jgi:Zn-dependent metalloprotease
MKRKFMFVAMMAAMCSTALFTACTTEEGDDAEVLATNVNFDNLTTVAQTDGTILIEGSISANGKIKTFELQTLDGKTIVDLATKNEKSVDKDENGKKVKTYTMDISSVAVPVQQMQIVFKVKDGETGKGCAQIGQTYEFDAGTGESVKGSYMSFSQNRSYTFAEVVDATTGEATANAQNVEVILGKGEDGKPTLKSAKEAKSEKFKNAAGDAKIFPNAVLTSTNCIATYNIVFGEDGITAKVSGVIIKTGDGGIMKIDNSALFK